MHRVSTGEITLRVGEITLRVGEITLRVGRDAMHRVSTTGLFCGKIFQR